MIYASTLASRQRVAEGTEAFHFTRPDGFEFAPGQALELLLPSGEPEGAPLGHAFSIVSAPHEREVVIATRMRDSAYKRALATLQPGAVVQLDGPFGELVLDDSARPVVLIAGGIGITPFMSMLRHAARQRATRAMALVYSNRRPQDAAFLAELQSLGRAQPGFRLHATMTAPAAPATGWSGLSRHIDADMLAAAASSIGARSPRGDASAASAARTPQWYVAGPPKLVAAAGMALDDLGVPEGDVHREEFEGY
jgi:ferredoxin-NADP reductase